MAKIKSIIQQEIEWCLLNPATNLSADFQKGFVAGLKQAEVLEKKIKKHTAKAGKRHGKA